jgi:hypothetical protein
MVSLALVTTVALPARADWDDRTPGQKAGYTALAAVENVVPIVSALGAPKCLPGYIFCKAFFAFSSVVAAGEQIIMSGGGDDKQTNAVLYRGFAGDWYLTGAHAAGDLVANPLPDPGPSSNSAPGSGSEPLN